MAKGRLRKTDRVCALCRNWNGTVGSTTIQPVLGGGLQVEMKEKETCYQRSGTDAIQYNHRHSDAKTIKNNQL